MTTDWYPGIRECCTYWGSDATMMQQTFDALEKAFAEENDACIDCAKGMVEVVCRVIVDELDNPANPQKPTEENPTFGKWVATAVRVLKLGDVRHNAFQKLVSQHHKLTETLGALRNEAGPVSHGKEAFIDRLSTYHRRAAILSADAIVAFLHAAYMEAEVRLTQTKLPYEHFEKLHPSIDRWASITLEGNQFEGYSLAIALGSEVYPVAVEASRILFQFDKPAYVEALREGQALDVAGFDAITDVDLLGEQ